MAGVVEGHKVGLYFTIPLTEDVGLAGAAGMNHGHLR